jgi:hypothetical protein
MCNYHFHVTTRDEVLRSIREYKAPSWRDADPVIKAFFSTRAMQCPLPFTLNLTDEVVERAKQQDDPFD